MEISKSRDRWKLSDAAKSVVIASSATALARIEPSMRAGGIATERRAENLGVDFQLGGPLKRIRQKERVEAVKGRLGRFTRLGTKAGTHVYKTGGVPAVAHGTAICGITLATLRQVNRMAARAGGKNIPRSSFAR